MISSHSGGVLLPFSIGWKLIIFPSKLAYKTVDSGIGLQELVEVHLSWLGNLNYQEVKKEEAVNDIPIHQCYYVHPLIFPFLDLVIKPTCACSSFCDEDQSPDDIKR